jgi:hypothetical protein
MCHQELVSGSDGDEIIAPKLKKAAKTAKNNDFAGKTTCSVSAVSTQKMFEGDLRHCSDQVDN